MKQQSPNLYTAPEVEIVEVAIERGIATTNDIDDLPVNNGPKF